MEVNCETLAVMGATLANGGMCPTTGKPYPKRGVLYSYSFSYGIRSTVMNMPKNWADRVLSQLIILIISPQILLGDVALNPGAVRDALSLMHSCGMYNYSGQFAFDVIIIAAN